MEEIQLWVIFPYHASMTYAAAPLQDFWPTACVMATCKPASNRAYVFKDPVMD